MWLKGRATEIIPYFYLDQHSYPLAINSHHPWFYCFSFPPPLHPWTGTSLPLFYCSSPSTESPLHKSSEFPNKSKILDTKSKLQQNKISQTQIVDIGGDEFGRILSPTTSGCLISVPAAIFLAATLFTRFGETDSCSPCRLPPAMRPI